jgi:hypothetical protein
VLAIDILHVVLVGRQLSAGADAAALAGALEVRRDTGVARDRAVAFALENYAAGDTIQIDRNDSNTPTGDVVIGRWRRSDNSFDPMPPATGLPNAVQVLAPRTDSSLGGEAPTLFASFLGINSVAVERRATAAIIGDIGPAVLALNASQSCSFDMRGSTAQLDVSGGAIVIDSSAGFAACHSGQPDIDADEMYVVGGLDNKFRDQVDVSGEVFTDDPNYYMPDPLAALPEPAVPTVDHGDVMITGGVATIDPGHYDNLVINGGTTTFNSGVYYVSGEFEISGNAVIDGSAGIMVFVGPAGEITMTGTGAVTIAPMNPLTYAPDGPAVPVELDGTLVSIFQARDNTNEAFFRGTNDWNVGGTIYIPDGHMSVGGTMENFSNGLIADTIEIFGTGAIGVDFLGQLPPIPRRVFLVQ